MTRLTALWIVEQWVSNPETAQHRTAEIHRGGRIHLIRVMAGTKGRAVFPTLTSAAKAIEAGISDAAWVSW